MPVDRHTLHYLLVCICVYTYINTRSLKLVWCAFFCLAWSACGSGNRHPVATLMKDKSIFSICPPLLVYGRYINTYMCASGQLTTPRSHCFKHAFDMYRWQKLLFMLQLLLLLHQLLMQISCQEVQADENPCIFEVSLMTAAVICVSFTGFNFFNFFFFFNFMWHLTS